ncbi:hypothetical protein HJC23_005324 [Cyclotella cryptica]|uniref:HSF-type DNA-binding domain-containing protein n=1 Tax=Cyclotella cryptica TaxID=29204 RepID=A0ABD3P8Z3_9STRA|eukprot:CCRYP_016990-RA/>CCRYP_016990-RA protein AED:0.08 eAED:0.08 QI:51/1/1/1/1/1/4/218/363
MAAKPPPIYNGETVNRNASGPSPELQYDSLSSKNSNPRLAPPPRRIDHTYHDWATYPPDDHALRTTKKSNNNFPAKLHRILSNPEHAHAICWQPHGRAWKIKDKKLLVEKVIPKYFTQSKFESFTRQLSGWGFKRLHQSGPDFHCYYHECFLRGLPHLTRMMKRSEPNLGKLLPFVDAEPNFYDMDLKYPLPPSNLQHHLTHEDHYTSVIPPPYQNAPPVSHWEAYHHNQPMAIPAHRYCDSAQRAQLYPNYHTPPPQHAYQPYHQYSHPYAPPHLHQSYPLTAIPSTSHPHQPQPQQSPYFGMTSPEMFSCGSSQQQNQHPDQYPMEYYQHPQQYPQHDAHCHQLYHEYRAHPTECPPAYDN